MSLSNDSFDAYITPIQHTHVKLKKLFMIKGHPCRVTNADISAPGKHGHAKLNVTGVCLHCDKKFNMAGLKGHSNGQQPDVLKVELDVAYVDEDNFQLMMEDGNIYEGVSFEAHGPQSKEHLIIKDKYEEAVNTNKKCIVILTRMPLVLNGRETLFDRLNFDRLDVQH